MDVNLNADLDPDFGRCSVDVHHIYQCIITPKTHNFSWFFYILLPDFEEESYLIKMVENIVREVIGKGDRYAVYPLDEQKYEVYDKSSPVIAFDPFIGDFVWLKPPKNHTRNWM